MKERQPRTQSFSKKGAAYPWIGALKVNRINTHQQQRPKSLRAPCPVGGHVFHCSKRVGRDETKQKYLIKPLFDKFLPGFLYDWSVSVDEMILDILKERKGKGGS